MLRWLTRASSDAAFDPALEGDLKALRSALDRGADVNWKGKARHLSSSLSRCPPQLWPDGRGRRVAIHRCTVLPWTATPTA